MLILCWGWIPRCPIVTWLQIFLVHRLVWCYRCLEICGPLVWCFSFVFRFLVHRSVWCYGCVEISGPLVWCYCFFLDFWSTAQFGCYRCLEISGPLVWCYCWQVQHIPSATSWLASHPLIAAQCPTPQICPTFFLPLKIWVKSAPLFSSSSSGPLLNPTITFSDPTTASCSASWKLYQNRSFWTCAQMCISQQ